ncbi:hypothetical protein BKA83DRAFT_4279353, partial [Pisolithus microcarpus]
MKGTEKKELYRLAHPVSRYLPSRLVLLCTPRKPISPQPLSVPQRERYHQVDRNEQFHHTKNPDNSGTVDACATSCISSGRYRRVVSRLRKACDSVENYLGYGPNAVGARRAALRRWGTAGRCPTKLREVVGRNMGTWEKRKAGEKLHPFPRYLLN